MLSLLSQQNTHDGSVHAHSSHSERKCYWQWKLNGVICSMFIKYVNYFFGYNKDRLTGQGMSYFLHF